MRRLQCLLSWVVCVPSPSTPPSFTRYPACQTKEVHPWGMVLGGMVSPRRHFGMCFVRRCPLRSKSTATQPIRSFASRAFVSQ